MVTGRAVNHDVSDGSVGAWQGEAVGDLGGDAAAGTRYEG
jgi:hypothetical protein